MRCSSPEGRLFAGLDHLLHEVGGDVGTEHAFDPAFGLLFNDEFDGETDEDAANRREDGAGNREDKVLLLEHDKGEACIAEGQDDGRGLVPGSPWAGVDPQDDGQEAKQEEGKVLNVFRRRTMNFPVRRVLMRFPCTPTLGWGALSKGVGAKSWKVGSTTSDQDDGVFEVGEEFRGAVEVLLY